MQWRYTNPLRSHRAWAGKARRIAGGGTCKLHRRLHVAVILLHA
jgi:hypothetical protein